MSLPSQAGFQIPEETQRVARAAFPKGTLCLRIADALGAIYQNQEFAALFPTRGQPAEAPARLALATVLQFVEGLSFTQRLILLLFSSAGCELRTVPCGA